MVPRYDESSPLVQGAIALMLTGSFPKVARNFIDSSRKFATRFLLYWALFIHFSSQGSLIHLFSFFSVLYWISFFIFSFFFL